MFYWDPDPVIFTIPYVDWPILWYGALFALGFAVGFRIFLSILRRFFRLQPNYSVEDHRKALLIADRLVVYMVIAVVVGARLGHFLFYEKPSDYLRDPWEIFRIWEGGLASHGAMVAIIIALILFSRRIQVVTRKLNWVRLLDLIAAPTAFCACCIRIGNFFNQEILGTPTSLPWAVTFGHPADRSMPVPRHPVQLYEAFFYLLVFWILWRLTYQKRFLVTKGKLIGLFLMLVFGFRFLIEFFKLEQSHLLSAESYLVMGQLLSIPAIVLGVVFYFWPRKASPQ